MNRSQTLAILAAILLSSGNVVLTEEGALNMAERVYGEALNRTCADFAKQSSRKASTQLEEENVRKASS